MRKPKKGVVIPFLGVSGNETLNANSNSTNASLDLLCNRGVAAPVAKANIEDVIVHCEEIDNKNNIEVKINDELLFNIYSRLIKPINVIHGAVQFMELHLKNNFEKVNEEKVDKSINLIKENCLMLIKTINILLDLMRIEADQFSLDLSDVNIVEVVENIVSNASHIIKEKQLNITFDTNIEEKIVSCDAERIKRVILNLLSNAIKFSNPGENIFINVIANTNSVEISVADEGTGIDKKHLESTIDLRVKEDELNAINTNYNNIELSMSKYIIELHGGKLIEYNDSNVSIFTIELPCTSIDSIYFMYNKENNINYENLITMINIELSDINNTGWK